MSKCVGNVANADVLEWQLDHGSVCCLLCIDVWVGVCDGSVSRCAGAMGWELRGQLHLHLRLGC